MYVGFCSDGCFLVLYLNIAVIKRYSLSYIQLINSCTICTLGLPCKAHFFATLDSSILVLNNDVGRDIMSV